MAKEVLSVGEFLDQINLVLEPKKVVVQGEIGKITVRDRAVYFTINDCEQEASLSCFAWKNQIDSFGFELEEGLEVKIYGFGQVYKPSGRLSFQIKRMTPVGEGALKKAFDKLVQKLKDLGYFSPERKRQIPTYVKKIGLITSKKAAALKDFNSHLGKHGFEVQFYDVRVEGMRAVEEVVRAIEWFNKNPKEVEVIVVTRGGGSWESLQAFNSHEVAEAIYASKIPVISAIGHERDITISDMVADLRASTPTDAGKRLTEAWIIAIETIENSKKNILSTIRRRLVMEKENIDGLCQNLIDSFARQVSWQRKKLSDYEQKLALADPKQKLKQGYSLVVDKNGKIIRSAKDLELGDIIEVRFFRNKLDSKIIKIYKENGQK